MNAKKDLNEIEARYEEVRKKLDKKYFGIIFKGYYEKWLDSPNVTKKSFEGFANYLEKNFKVKVSYQAVSDWANGKSKPDLKKFIAICRAMNKSPEDFLPKNELEIHLFDKGIEKSSIDALLLKLSEKGISHNFFRMLIEDYYLPYDWRYTLDSELDMLNMPFSIQHDFSKLYLWKDEKGTHRLTEDDLNTIACIQQKVDDLIIKELADERLKSIEIDLIDMIQEKTPDDDLLNVIRFRLFVIHVLLPEFDYSIIVNKINEVWNTNYIVCDAPIYLDVPDKNIKKRGKKNEKELEQND